MYVYLLNICVIYYSVSIICKDGSVFIALSIRVLLIVVADFLGIFSLVSLIW